MTNYNYRIQQQHIAMARKRHRRARAQQPQQQQQHLSSNGNHPHANGGTGGVMVNIRQIGKSDEGVLYTHRITERRHHEKERPLSLFSRLFRRRPRRAKDDVSVASVRSGAGDFPMPRYRRSISRQSGDGAVEAATPLSPPPQSDTLKGFRTFFGKHQKQYTIASKKKYRSNVLNWFDKYHMNFVDYFWHRSEVDTNVYSPSASLYLYIDWTFTAYFTSVFLSFLLIYLVLCVVFGGLLFVAGNHEPNCIVATGEPFGKSGNPHTAWSDAFALSWTTFTTVGYGMTYTSTANDFGDTKPAKCSWVVFLCTVEAFLGLLFAGMCAAILFSKVNRIQSHANLVFCNAVCLQYEEMEDEPDIAEYVDSERSGPSTPVRLPALDDEENQLDTAPQSSAFVDQFNGCPILKFQVVNELSNREGSELVDCIMKVVGIKFKGPNGTVTHSQYVRVNLVDFEHPFLSRVWHGVHILDSTSPLLTDRARQRIEENKGSWPSTWLDPEVIRRKLEFHDLIVTVAGISNVSAVTVHAYKRYKIGDVLIGYNFAPIVFRDPDSGALEVDITMCHDVREQYGIRGEDLSTRRTGSKEYGIGPGGLRNLESTIRIKTSKSGDGLGPVTSHNSGNVKVKPSMCTVSPSASPANSAKGDISSKVSPLDDSEPETSEDDILSPKEDALPKESSKKG